MISSRWKNWGVDKKWGGGGPLRPRPKTTTAVTVAGCLLSYVYCAVSLVGSVCGPLLFNLYSVHRRTVQYHRRSWSSSPLLRWWHADLHLDASYWHTIHCSTFCAVHGRRQWVDGAKSVEDEHWQDTTDLARYKSTASEGIRHWANAAIRPDPVRELCHQPRTPHWQRTDDVAQYRLSAALGSFSWGSYGLLEAHLPRSVPGQWCIHSWAVA